MVLTAVGVGAGGTPPESQAFKSIKASSPITGAKRTFLVTNCPPDFGNMNLVQHQTICCEMPGGASKTRPISLDVWLAAFLGTAEHNSTLKN